MSATLASKTGAQVVVVTVDILEGKKLVDVSLNILRSWGIGDAKKNNGVLLFLVKSDALVRIEVGYGLEATLTNKTMGDILDKDALPFFKEGKYDQVVINTYTSIVKLVAAEYGLDLAAIGASDKLLDGGRLRANRGNTNPPYEPPERICGHEIRDAKDEAISTPSTLTQAITAAMPA